MNDPRSARTAVLFAAGFALAACAGPEAVPPGVPEIRLEEVQRFGSLAGDGSALSSVRAVELTDSTLLILESSPARVAVFDLDGRWLRDIGRAGEGPGEFRRPSALGVLDGKVWVGSSNGGRLEVLTMQGRSVSSHRWEVPADSLSEQALPSAQLADGSILTAPTTVIRPDRKARPYHRADAEGEVIEELYRMPVQEGEVFVAQHDAGFSIGIHPLNTAPIVARLPEGRGLLVVGRNEARSADSASITVQRIEIDRSTSIRIPYRPRSAEGWLEALARDMEERMAESGDVDHARISSLTDAMQPRRFYPPVSQAVAGTDGSIWLRRERVIVADSATWEAYTQAGELRARFRAPINLRILRASLDEVWTVETNDLDVPFVVRNRVAR